eukprot:symbB.v1.2.006389.t1/scaffold358.1/size381540/12
MALVDFDGLVVNASRGNGKPESNTVGVAQLLPMDKRRRENGNLASAKKRTSLALDRVPPERANESDEGGMTGGAGDL